MAEDKKPAIEVDVNMVRAFLHMRKGETLEQFRKLPNLSGPPVPVYCCVACSTLYADPEGETPIHDDGRPALAECPCMAPELVDARTLKFDYEAPACAGCGAIFEAPDKATVLVEGVVPGCAHGELIPVNARERGIAFWEDSGRLKPGVPPVPVHIVRAVRLGQEVA